MSQRKKKCFWDCDLREKKMSVFFVQEEKKIWLPKEMKELQ
jgi:hypothetical protein